jgi:tetratricopeptide (TPR) repeat protein/tRNA A-37 threonylcarbamoyl transferase component Bud32
MPTEARFGPYEIIEQIGHGGMGLVYRARDTRLHRDVALKLVAESYIAGGTPIPSTHERFFREARASSALNHPNICTIYDVGEHQGQPYLVMELLEGDTLKRIIHGLPLPVDQLLDYGLQLCSALVEAHARGIFHRDIKPANLFITRRDQGFGLLKVLDFGIAKQTLATASTSDSIADLTRSQAESTLSAEGAALGTVAYMAPEQARGETVDARADVFSAGVVLYEMATGTSPFFGGSVAEVFAALLTREPESIRKRDPLFPRELERVIFKALAKDKTQRYASAAALRADLERVQAGLLGLTGAGIPTASFRITGSHVLPRRKRSIWKPAAILIVILLTLAAAYGVYAWRQGRPRPRQAQADAIIVSEFTNRTGDPEFDGVLRQALSDELGQSPYLNVIGDLHLRDSLAFLARQPDEKVTPAVAREIAEREGDKAVVNGAISRIGSEYLITLEAQNALTGDVFARAGAQTGSSSGVPGALRAAAVALRRRLEETIATIPKPDISEVRRATTSSMRAYRAYALGEHEHAQAQFAQSIESYQRAVEIDPNFAMAWARMGAAFVAIGNQTDGDKAITTAFDLSGRVSDEERLYIRVQYFLNVTGDLPQAIDTLKQYGQGYPTESVVPTDLSVAYLMLGKFEEAYGQVRKALALSPRSASGYVNGLLALTSLDRFDEAKEMYQKAESLGLADDASIRGTWVFTVYLTGDQAAVQQQIAWARDRTDGYLMDAQVALLDENEGRLGKAGDEWKRAVDQLTLQKMAGATSSMIAQRTLDAALAARCEGATTDLDRAMKLDHDRSMEGTAAIAYALCGDQTTAESISQSLAKAYPRDTLINHVYLPDISAAIQLKQKHPEAALEALNLAEDYDSLGIGSYLRGLAHLALNDGAGAAKDFNYPLSHRSVFILSQLPGMNMAYPLSLLGLARAEALQGDKAKAREQYAGFFAYWKNADPDLPPLLFARTEAAALGQ